MFLAWFCFVVVVYCSFWIVCLSYMRVLSSCVWGVGGGGGGREGGRGKGEGGTPLGGRKRGGEDGATYKIYVRKSNTWM